MTWNTVLFCRWVKLYSFLESTYKWYHMIFVFLSLTTQQTIIQKGTCSSIVTAALFTIARTWKQPKCPSTEEWIKNDMAHIDNGILFSHKKEWNNAICSDMHRNLEIVILSEVKHLGLDIFLNYVVTLHVCIFSFSVVSDSLQPNDYSPPGSFVHGIFLVRLLEWVTVFSSRGYSWPRNWNCVSCLGFPGGSEVKASACNAGDLGSIPGSGRSPGEGNATHSSILAWRIPWMEEPGGL